jgi:hypothetical protein
MRPVCVAFFLLLSSSAAGAQTMGGHPVAAMPVVQRWQRFSDPNEGAFELEMPQGWKVSGGTVRHNALQYRGWASAISPDGATVLGINDPTEQSYATPMYGFPAGSIYNGGGGTSYLVAPYESGVQFAMSWGSKKLQPLCTSIKVTAKNARLDLTQQINALSPSMGVSHDFGEATFGCEKSGMPMTAYVFASTTAIRTGPQGGLWYPDIIEAFLAPSPVAGLAAGLLAHMVKSVRLNPTWVARQSQTNVDVSRIAAQTNAAISDSIMHGWQARGATMDRVMEEGSRARLGIDVYADPATGTQYTVASSHQYYWANAGGTVVGTDTDTSPGAAFSRLNRVPPQ